MRHSSTAPASWSTAAEQATEQVHPVLDDLITLLQLERIEKNIFRGERRDIGSA